MDASSRPWPWHLPTPTMLLLPLAVVAIVCLALYPLYLLALPQPLPGIPYNAHASKRLMGDIPDVRRARHMRQWIWSQPRSHGAPLCQVFVLPFRRPTVIVSDHAAVVDILARRSREFDRGQRVREIVGLVAPDFHFTMETREDAFRAHKELVRDLMTPRFLNEIASPRVYDAFAALVALWQEKGARATGQPFAASHDLYLTTLDSICSVAFGIDASRRAVAREIDHVRSLPVHSHHHHHHHHHHHPSSPVMASTPVDFSRPAPDAEIDALLDIPEMLSISQKSGFPWLAQRLALLRPRHARAQRDRRALLRRQTDASLERLARGGEGAMRCALDWMLWREMARAEREQRAADCYSTVIRDEAFGFLLGGHDTSATVLSWWVKYMAAYPAVQARLRAALRDGHPEAAMQGRWPTMAEIVGASIPYLEAVVHETLRCASIVTLISRTTTQDTQVLGYPIPRDTNILLSLAGPGLTEPALHPHPLDFAKPCPSPSPSPSSPSSSPCPSHSTTTPPAWDDADIGLFRPERWLKHSSDEKGAALVFDARAGPLLAFSAGPRGCFGRRLGEMQLRTAVTLLVWNFAFGSTGAMGGMEILEKFVNMPRDCYVRLGPV